MSALAPSLAVTPTATNQQPAPESTYFSGVKQFLNGRAAQICAAVCALSLLSSCQEPYNAVPFSELQKPMEPEIEQRFEVSHVTNFQDDLAYDGVRGIYILKDNKTGTEYIGISGIGISEIGSHRVGKTIQSDER